MFAEVGYLLCHAQRSVSQVWQPVCARESVEEASRCGRSPRQGRPEVVARVQRGQPLEDEMMLLLERASAAARWHLPSASQFAGYARGSR